MEHIVIKIFEKNKLIITLNLTKILLGSAEIVISQEDSFTYKKLLIILRRYLILTIEKLQVKYPAKNALNNTTDDFSEFLTMT